MFDKLEQRLRNRRVPPVRLAAQKGQSLVEMAITAPLLIFMLIGLFEVGWALRSYIVLVNVNREITRFAVRPGYLDFSTQAAVDTSYQGVRDWVDTALSGQLELDFDEASGDTTLIVSHLVVDTGLPCEDILTNPGGCDCDAFLNDPGNANKFTLDDLIIHPGMSSHEYQAQRFGPTATVTGARHTRFDYTTLTADLAANNNNFNCQVLKKGGVTSANNAIITELYLDQPQLFGFPLISNPFTDPVPLYTHTIMRLVSAARSSGSVEGSLISGIDTIGPICLAYPMLVSDGVAHNDQVNIIEDGWPIWNTSSYPDPPLMSNEGDYLEFALGFPQMSLNDFPTPGGVQPGLSVDKGTATYPGLQEEVEALVGRQIVIPTSSNPANDPAVISGFILVTIESDADIDLNSGEILARVDRVSELPGGCPAP